MRRSLTQGTVPVAPRQCGTVEMFNLDLLIDSSELATLLSDEFAHFARPIMDGLTVFLTGLPADRQAEVMMRQSALPSSATVSQRLELLARCCPALHKLGQVLARDQRLAPELRHQLQKLESLPPSISLEVIQETLRDELGSLTRLGVTLEPPAIAEASVAVVIPFRQDNAIRSRGSAPADVREGVFKILKPGIEERLQQELAMLEQVGAYLDERCDELTIPRLDYEESFQQIRGKLQEEVRLDHEQRHLVAAREFYADEPRVQIPRLMDHCTARVTAMERIRGVKVTDHQLAHSRDARRLMRLVVQQMLARPIFCREKESVFHSDPHAGNLYFTRDGRLAILDWSLVGVLGNRERVAIVQIILGAVTLDAPRIVTILEELAPGRRTDRAALTRVVQNWLRRIRHGQWPGITWLVGMLDEAVRSARLRLAADLMLFRKTLHTLEGVLVELGGNGRHTDEVLLDQWLRHLASEWPRRWTARPNSRNFPTRLSNVDLAHTALSMPLTASRFWTEQSIDWLRMWRAIAAARG